MKLLIAGSRSLNHLCGSHLFELIDITLGKRFMLFTEIISGGCPKGPDSLAKPFAKLMELEYKEFPALWNEHGKAAGPIRNKQMAEYADELLLIWDGKSNGSKNMKHEMEKLNKKVYEVIIKV